MSRDSPLHVPPALRDSQEDREYPADPAARGGFHGQTRRGAGGDWRFSNYGWPSLPALTR
jgi:hypothetical protein